MTASSLPDTAARATAARRLTLLGFTVEAKALLTVLGAFAVTRLIIFFIIFISSAVIPMRQGPFLYSDPNNLVLDGLVRDDSWWYTNIVTRGYSIGNIERGEQGNVAFFPVYPLLVRMAMGLTGNPFVAGILVSNVAFLVTLGYLYTLTRLEFDDEAAARAVFYLAAAPTAIFFSAMYTESVYLAFVTATFCYARQAKWDSAALAGALATATRNTGILLVAVVLLEAMQHNGFRLLPARWTYADWQAHWRPQLAAALRSWRGMFAAVVVSLGLILYMAYLANTFGDPLAFIHVQATWGRQAPSPNPVRLVSHIVNGLAVGPRVWAGQINVGDLLNLLATLGFLPLVIAAALKMRPSYAVYTVLTFLIPMSTGSLGSMTRYILMLFPCFMLLGQWGRRVWIDRFVLTIALPLMAYFTIIFSHWYFAG